MTNKIVPINKDVHAHTRINPAPDYRHAENFHLTRVTANEIALASLDYPIMLIREPDTDRYHCTAMFGFENGENLFFREKKWRSAYVPSNITIVPFTFGSDQGDAQTLVPSLIENSPYVNTQSGHALFDDAGNKTEYLKKAEQDLQDLYTNEVATQRFVERLKSLEMLRPFSLDLAYSDGNRKSVVGMYMVSNERLNALGDSEILEFFKNGYLIPIYAMLSSLNKVYTMIEYKNEKDGPAITGFEYKLRPESG